MELDPSLSIYQSPPDGSNSRAERHTMNVEQVIGLEGGRDATWVRVLAEEGRGTTKYSPAIIDGVERAYSEFDSLDDYLAHKVMRERETIRLIIAGNPIVAEDAIMRMLGCKALATSPTTVDVYPDQPIIDDTTAAATLGRHGGQSTSAAKISAARRNGRLGGRPRKHIGDDAS